MFHSVDALLGVVRISDGRILFSGHEVQEVRGIMALLFDVLNNDVYGAAYPVVMKVFGSRLDA
ncbi:MAG: hypothetical protein AB7U65_08915 [Halothiobacillaceae bacterium]